MKYKEGSDPRITMALFTRSTLIRSIRNTQAIRGNKGSRGWDWYYKAKANSKIVEEAAAFPDNESNIERKQAFFDIGVEGENYGRIIFELANDLAPIGAENFLALCSGVEIDNENRGYKGTSFHTVRKDFLVQGGDIDGEGGRCVPSLSNDMSGFSFKDECLNISHSTSGILSMASPGVDGNGSQFFITTAPAKHLDAQHQIIGRVIEGLDIVKKLTNVFAVNGKPVSDIIVTECGEL